jgi:hypothetical protein
MLRIAPAGCCAISKKGLVGAVRALQADQVTRRRKRTVWFRCGRIVDNAAVLDHAFMMKQLSV